MEVLWKTVSGSHVWSMNRPDSDIDEFTAYITPSKDILCGINRGWNSHFHAKEGAETHDRVSHEIGKVVDELINGNINFLIGTLSPIVISEHSDCLRSLKDLIIKYGQTKACVNSIRGLAIHNYRKYIIGSDTARDYPLTKKCNNINRCLLFGIRLLKGNGFIFDPVINQTPNDVKTMLELFDINVKVSTLPEKTNPEPFREYLLNLRLKELDGTL